MVTKVEALNQPFWVLVDGKPLAAVRVETSRNGDRNITCTDETSRTFDRFSQVEILPEFLPFAVTKGAPRLAGK